MADLFNQQFSPEIIRATDELREKMGRLHAAAMRSGSVWAGIRQAVNNLQCAGSIKRYMEILLESSPWGGGDELRQRLRLHLNGGYIANWQLIARDHAAGIDYYVYPTLRDLILNKRHWGLGLTEEQLRAYIEPEDPSLWVRIEAAIHHGRPGQRTDLEPSTNNGGRLRGDPARSQQDRSRALARAVERAEVKALFDGGLIPKGTATLYGQKSKDESHEQLKEDCLATAYQLFQQARNAIASQPTAEQPKALKQTKKAITETMAPLKRWQPKPLGPAKQQGWAKEAASLLADSYTPDELHSLISELLLVTPNQGC